VVLSEFGVKLIRFFTTMVVIASIWLLWPRDLGGTFTGKDGRLAAPDYGMSRMRYVSVKQGKLEMESNSASAAYDMSRSEMVGFQSRSFFYNNDGEPTRVESDKTTFRTDQKKIYLLGNVRSTSPDGFEMLSDQAEYDMAKRYIVAPMPVEGSAQDQSLRVWADRAESFIDTNKIYLIGNARSETIDKKGVPTKIRGERAYVFRDQEKVTFEEKVRVEQGKTEGDSGEAHFFYSPKERTVKYLSMLQDVKIRDVGGKNTRSQVAEFFAPSDTIVLSGFPTVYDGDDVVSGDRITLYRTTGVVEVTAANALGNPEQPAAKEQPKFTKEDEELIP